MNSPFFIVASPRSGTTLLERMLNRHAEIFIPPETEFFFILNQAGFLARPYDVEGAKRAVDFYLGKKPAGLLGLNDISGIRGRLLEGAESYADIFMNLLGLLAEGSEYSVVGEKTPHHLRCLPRILEAFPDSRIIVLVRDGRAVVSSHLRQPNWEKNLLAAAESSRNDSRLIQHLLENDAASRVVLVSYEDLLAEPEKKLAALCEFIGVDYLPGMHETSEVIPGKFAEYYRQPWMSKSTDKIDVSRAESWKKEYRPVELRMIEKVMGEYLGYFGYELQSLVAPSWPLLYAREWLRHKGYRLKVRLAG